MQNLKKESTYASKGISSRALSLMNRAYKLATNPDELEKSIEIDSLNIKLVQHYAEQADDLEVVARAEWTVKNLMKKYDDGAQCRR